MTFVDKLQRRIAAAHSLLCVGLDPHLAELPEPTAEAAQRHCLDLIAATRHVAAAYKPNVAFFEALGHRGIQALEAVCAAVPDDIPVILDAKRGDIASTADAYARAAWQVFDADAVTLNAYLGKDAIAPFLADPERGVFVLCKTSNPGSADLQDLTLAVDGGLMPVWEAVARMCNDLDDGTGRVGLVVGATHPAALARIRAVAPRLWILAPGVGAQGGELAATVQAGLRDDGAGLLIPVSRAISRAADLAAAAEALRDAINTARTEAARDLLPTAAFPAQLAAELVTSGCVRFGTFTLKSGLSSPIYIDLRRLISTPSLLHRAAAAYVPLLADLTWDRLAPLPYAAVPIGTALSLLLDRPMVYPRKEAKSYGTRADIEGDYTPGDRVVVIDDLATTGGSKLEAFDKLEAAGLTVAAVAVLIDRQSGADALMAARGVPMRAVFRLTELLEYWRDHELVPADQIDRAFAFLDAHA